MYNVKSVISLSDTALVLAINQQKRCYAVKRILVNNNVVPADISVRGHLYAGQGITAVQSVLYTYQKGVLFANVFFQQYSGTARYFFAARGANTTALAVFMHDTLLALTEMHRVGVSHRNLRLSNILYSSYTGALHFAVTDYRLSGRGKTSHLSTSPVCTSIEQVCGMEVGCELDVYQLGVCVLEILGVAVQEIVHYFVDYFYVLSAEQSQIEYFIDNIADAELRQLLKQWVAIKRPQSAWATVRAADSFKQALVELGKRCTALPAARPPAYYLLDDLRLCTGIFGV